MFLARVNVADNRQVDALVVELWTEVIGDLEYEDCVAAHVLHLKESTDYLKPAHIIENVKRIRSDLAIRGRSFLLRRYEYEWGSVCGADTVAIGRAMSDPEKLGTLITAIEEDPRNQHLTVRSRDVRVPAELTVANPKRIHPDDWMQH